MRYILSIFCLQTTYYIKSVAIILKWQQATRKEIVYQHHMLDWVFLPNISFVGVVWKYGFEQKRVQSMKCSQRVEVQFWGTMYYFILILIEWCEIHSPRQNPLPLILSCLRAYSTVWLDKSRHRMRGHNKLVLLFLRHL